MPNIRLFACLFFILLSGGLFAQRVLTGLVSDRSGEPLIGVNILIKGTGQGTATGIDGRYRLSLPEGDPVLVFSYTGMKPQERRAGTRTVLNVVMEADVQTFDEIVVTAYAGPKKEKDLVGSYNQVEAAELQTARPIESFDKMLAGRVAGVQVETVTGEPGLPVRVRIRGEGSLPPVGSVDVTASGQPLYVVDGVPLYDITETNASQSEFSSLIDQRLNPLMFINPEDIESITVLKDASATALYGANAANGVVLITTRQGQSGRTRISAGISQGFSHTINEIKFLNTAQYVELYRETLFNSGENPANAGPTDIETDWRELVTRVSSTTAANLSISNGNDKGRFRFSTNYYNQQAISKGNGLERISASLNASTNLSRNLEFSTSWKGGYVHKESFNSFGVFSFPPNIPPILPDGSFNNGGFFINRANPLAALEQNEFFHDAFSLNGNISLSYSPLPDLRIRALAGIDGYQQNQFRHDSALNGSGRTRNGYGIRFNRGNLQWIANAQASWTPTLGRSHHLSLLGGTEATRQNTQLLKVTATNFPFDALRQLGTVENSRTDVNESRFVRATQSFYGEAGYDYDYRYYIKLNGRRDASSLFGGDLQAATFFALGLGWAFSQEAFLKNWNWLSFGKLRFSYGVTGNSRLGTYSARGLYSYRNTFGYGPYIGLAPTAAPNDSLSWETKRQLNFGLDVHLLESRLKLTIEHYRHTTEDAITSIDVPLETGFSSIVANAASLLNRGWEMTLRSSNLRRGPLNWNTTLNIALNRNRILDIAVERPPGSSFVSAGLVIGNDAGAIYGVRYAGADPYNGKALFYLADGSITDDARLATLPENRGVIGRATPTFYGGLRNELSFGGFSFSMLIDYSYGSDIIVDALTFTDGRQIEFNNQSVNQLDRWQQPGDLTDTPLLHKRNFVQRNNTRYLFDNSYLQFSNADLSWQVPKAWLQKARLDQMVVFAQVNNLGYLYSTKTPRGRNGIAEYRFRFPESRTWLLGIKMDL